MPVFASSLAKPVDPTGVQLSVDQWACIQSIALHATVILFHPFLWAMQNCVAKSGNLERTTRNQQQESSGMDTQSQPKDPLSTPLRRIFASNGALSYNASHGIRGYCLYTVANDTL